MVLLTQLIDAPSAHPDGFPTQSAQEAERERIFDIMSRLVQWENSTDEQVLKEARTEIVKSCGNDLPALYDPFSGGCSIPLEAQRLGLSAQGSDINPVAVIIGKAMIEISPKFKDRKPVNPHAKKLNHRYAEGLAEDAAYYGDSMREKTWQKIGHLYPQIDLSPQHGDGKATVIAWLWARTVSIPDPAFADCRCHSFQVLS